MGRGGRGRGGGTAKPKAAPIAVPSVSYQQELYNRDYGGDEKDRREDQRQREADERQKARESGESVDLGAAGKYWKQAAESKSQHKPAPFEGAPSRPRQNGQRQPRQWVSQTQQQPQQRWEQQRAWQQEPQWQQEEWPNQQHPVDEPASSGAQAVNAGDHDNEVLRPEEWAKAVGGVWQPPTEALGGSSSSSLARSGNAADWNKSPPVAEVDPWMSGDPWSGGASASASTSRVIQIAPGLTRPPREEREAPADQHSSAASKPAAPAAASSSASASANHAHWAWNEHAPKNEDKDPWGAAPASMQQKADPWQPSTPPWPPETKSSAAPSWQAVPSSSSSSSPAKAPLPRLDSLKTLCNSGLDDAGLKRALEEAEWYSRPCWQGAANDGKHSDDWYFAPLVDVSDNKLTDDGVTILFEFLTKQRVLVGELRLHRNPGMRDPMKLVEFLDDQFKRAGARSDGKRHDCRTRELSLQPSDISCSCFWRLLEVCHKQKPRPPLQINLRGISLTASCGGSLDKVVSSAVSWGLVADNIGCARGAQDDKDVVITVSGHFYTRNGNVMEPSGPDAYQ